MTRFKFWSIFQTWHSLASWCLVSDSRHPTKIFHRHHHNHLALSMRTGYDIGGNRLCYQFSLSPIDRKDVAFSAYCFHDTFETQTFQLQREWCNLLNVFIVEFTWIFSLYFHVGYKFWPMTKKAFICRPIYLSMLSTACLGNAMSNTEFERLEVKE